MRLHSSIEIWAPVSGSHGSAYWPAISLLSPTDIPWSACRLPNEDLSGLTQGQTDRNAGHSSLGQLLPMPQNLKKRAQGAVF